MYGESSQYLLIDDIDGDIDGRGKIPSSASFRWWNQMAGIRIWNEGGLQGSVWAWKTTTGSSPNVRQTSSDMPCKHMLKLLAGVLGKHRCFVKWTMGIVSHSALAGVNSCVREEGVASESGYLQRRTSTSKVTFEKARAGFPWHYCFLFWSNFSQSSKFWIWRVKNVSRVKYMILYAIFSVISILD